MQFLAHPMDETGNGFQPYSDHIEGVYTRARVFFNHIREFSNFTDKEIEYIQAVIALVATYHDLGKLDPESQRLLSDIRLLKFNKMVNHVDAGAHYCEIKAVACKHLLSPFVLAGYIIQAHHLGLGFSPNKPIAFEGYYRRYLRDGLKLGKIKKGQTLWTDNSIRDMSLVTDRCPNYKTKETVEEYVDRTFAELLAKHNKVMTYTLKEDEFDIACPFVTVEKGKVNHGYLEHIIRLVLSLIVEADHGNTAESAGNLVCPKPVVDKTSSQKRLQNVKNYVVGMSVKFNSAQHTKEEKQKQKLRTLLQEVAEKYDYSTAGVFVLNAAVKYKKTTASLIAALQIESTFLRSARRIHYVSPLNAPGKQAAGEFRNAALNQGEEPFSLVGENYCDTNYKKMAEQASIDESFFYSASKTWDFPITVSSCEQFLRTISGCKTNSLRKYWNLVNSVVIIDEYQTLPPSILERLWDWMEFAAKDLNVKFVLVSGTPTEFYKKINAGRLIVENITTPELDRKMFEMEKNRVHYIPIGKITEQNLVDEICKDTKLGSTLTVVQTTLTAAYIYTLVAKKLGKDNVMYISRCLCNKDVDDRIEEMKNRLKNGEKFAVIATSILEAGIDLSFARVFGEYSRFTSIFQLAGRCNRHNEYPFGELKLFELTAKKDLITLNPSNILSRKVVREFIKNGRLSYKDCADAFALEQFYDRTSVEGKKNKIVEYTQKLDFVNLAEVVHAIEPDGEVGSDIQILIYDKAKASGLYQKLIDGEEFDVAEMTSYSFVLKERKAEKLIAYTKGLTPASFNRITKYNKQYLDLILWVGPYDEIGYLSTVLDPSAFV